jgi:hypothetical protein
MSQNKKGGKNSKVKLDAAQIRDIEVLSGYLPIAKIADYLGICEDTFHEIKKRDEKVLRAYKGGVGKAHAFAIKNMLSFMKYTGKSASELQLKFQATKFFLQTKGDWQEPKVDKDNNQSGARNSTKVVIKTAK